jgi:excisionase family DNA binding protein
MPEDNADREGTGLLDHLADNPRAVGDLPRDCVESLLGRVVVVHNALLARLLGGPAAREQALTEEGGPLLTIPEVARRLSVPLSYAYELARRGTIPTVRVGKKYVRVDARALRATMERWTDAAAGVEETTRLAYRPRRGSSRGRVDSSGAPRAARSGGAG